MSAEQIKVALCQGPTCKDFNQGLKNDLAANNLPFNIEQFCHGLCSKAPNAFVRYGNYPSRPVENATVPKIVEEIDNLRANPPTITPWNL